MICGPGERRDIPVRDIEQTPERYVRDGSGRAWFLKTYYDELTQTSAETSALSRHVIEEEASYV